MVHKNWNESIIVKHINVYDKIAKNSCQGLSEDDMTESVIF